LRNTDLEVLFRGGGRRNKENGSWNCKIKAAVSEPCLSVVTKWELSNAAKLSLFKSVFVPILTYGHEYRVMNEKILSQEQAERLSFCEEFTL